MIVKKVFFAGLLTMFLGISLNAQKINIKSNLLYDATTTLNLGLEFNLGSRTTFELPVNFNPWTFKDNKKLKHVLVQPELRFWTCESFTGHFWGIHAHYALFNVGGIKPFTQLEEHRFEGWLAGGGISYGYHWVMSNRWSMEATLGLGYAYIDYEKFECHRCGEKLKDDVHHYVGITKIGLSLIYFLK